MAWEWVAPVATGALGATGIVFTWLSGKQGRDHAERVAQIGNDHAATMAREQRTQQRLADTYVALLGMAERAGQWAQAVHPAMDIGLPVPRLPELSEQASVEALVGAFGSAEVRDLMRAWRETVRRIMRLDARIQMEQEGALRERPRTVNRGDAWEEIDQARVEERTARKALTDQIAAELGHRG